MREAPIKRGLLWAVGAGFVFFLAGCGGSSTPNTEGQKLAQARQTLREAGVPENNISVTGETGGDPNVLVVCDHDPDSVAPTRPLTLEVATACSGDDSDKKRKKKSNSSSGNKNRK